jgi:hypothetical protein
VLVRGAADVTKAEKRTSDTARLSLSGSSYGCDPTTIEDPEYAADEVEFMMAMESYKSRRRRRFPTWAEALGVLKSLGYTKTVKEDTREQPLGPGQGGVPGGR